MSAQACDGYIAPIVALVAIDPCLIDELNDADFLTAFGCDDDLWLRPEQHIQGDDWRYFGFICGRGFGKSMAIAVEINRRVEAGEARAIALMAPNEDRVDEVQIAFLIETAPPWFRPERHNGGLVWPNGVRAEVFTPEAPGRPRSGNFDLSWLCEIVDWQPTTRKEAFDNITTATRVRGVREPQVIWDTTSRGKNDVILHLLELNETDPANYPITRGTTFDNPMLSKNYLAAECKKYTGRKFDEEIKGLVFAESAGALWHQDWLDDNRRTMSPSPIALRLVAIDPAISTQDGADDTGLVVGSSDHVGDVYIEKDLSGRHAPEVWCELAVKECADNNAAGIVIERNRGGDVNIALIRVHAAQRGLVLSLLDKDAPFPRRVAGKLFVKEMWAATSKQSRAAAPSSYGQQGRVHHVGKFEALELELTTWEPGTRESPNKLDAHSYLIAELAGLNVERIDVPGQMKAAEAVSTKLREMMAKQRPKRIGI